MLRARGVEFKTLQTRENGLSWASLCSNFVPNGMGEIEVRRHPSPHERDVFFGNGTAFELIAKRLCHGVRFGKNECARCGAIEAMNRKHALPAVIANEGEASFFVNTLGREPLFHGMHQHARRFVNDNN
jgi:hypothetical protein